jgi:hypothetical protein
MSKGFGSVQRKIDQLFSGDPEGVFSTGDLASEVYGTMWPTKKERVAIIRAAHAVAKKHPGIHSWKSEIRGGSWFWFHHDNVMSYAIARLRCREPSNAAARRRLREDDRYAPCIVSGGRWWREVQEWIAERDGRFQTSVQVV